MKEDTKLLNEEDIIILLNELNEKFEKILHKYGIYDSYTFGKKSDGRIFIQLEDGLFKVAGYDRGAEQNPEYCLSFCSAIREVTRRVTDSFVKEQAILNDIRTNFYEDICTNFDHDITFIKIKKR